MWKELYKEMLNRKEEGKNEVCQDENNKILTGIKWQIKIEITK